MSEIKLPVRLDMAKAPPYRHQIDRSALSEIARAPLTIIPRQGSAINLERSCWLSNRFLEVV